MMVNKGVKQPAPERLARILCDLVYKLRQGKPAADFRWWNDQSANSMFTPAYGYQDSKGLFGEVVESILQLNAEMLSQPEVEKRLRYDFLQMQTIAGTEHKNGEELLNESREFLNELVHFEAWNQVDIPVANLRLEGEPIQIGKVNFSSATEADIKTWHDNKVMWPAKTPDVYVLAQVKAPGDQQKAIAYVEEQLDFTFKILRAFCFPFGKDSASWRIGILGDVLASTSTPMRFNKNQLVTKLGPPLAMIELKKQVLSVLNQKEWADINSLVNKQSHSKIEQKLLNAMHWLSEATKLDTNQGKFTKISIALESMLGGEADLEELKSRGIAATLAERAAFISSTILEERILIDRTVRKYYKQRSKIVHDGEIAISFDDIDTFGDLVRRTLIEFIKKLNNISITNLDELEQWIRNQKYYSSQETGAVSIVQPTS